MVEGMTAAPRIAVLGAGAMGCLFGGTLAEGGLDVILVDVRADHVDAINEHGLIIEGHGGPRTVRLPACVDPSSLDPRDIVLVQTKALHTEAALRGARSLFSSDTITISFQNGLGNEELIAEIVGVERVLAGLTAQGATGIAPGVIHNFGALPTYVGELGGGLSRRAAHIARLFTGAGLETHASADIRREMWKKLLGNVGLSPTSAITNLTSSEIMSVPELRQVVLDAVDEAAAVAAAEGIELDVLQARSVLEKLVDTTGGGTGQSRSSACVDIQNGRRTEVDWINGAIVRLGALHGIATPVNRTLVGAVKGLEKHFD
jgi:2-dehydropantoate 2-reductase